MTSAPSSLVLVKGHESGAGAQVAEAAALFDDCSVVTPGAALSEAVLRAQPGGAVVVPMTFGRDPAMIAETARGLRWLTERHAATVALSEPFGSPDHLIGHLRGVARKMHGTQPGWALLVTADAADPFDDAELYRIAHLVRVHGAGADVEVCLVNSPTDVEAAADRLQRLGYPGGVVVPAGFSTDFGVDLVPYLRFHGPLMRTAALARVIEARREAAESALADGRDGIVVALDATHDHGFAHSHGDETHTHTHTAGHSHTHGHSHDGHSHDGASSSVHSSPAALHAHS